MIEPVYVQTYLCHAAKRSSFGVALHFTLDQAHTLCGRGVTDLLRNMHTDEPIETADHWINATRVCTKCRAEERRARDRVDAHDRARERSFQEGKYQ